MQSAGWTRLQAGAFAAAGIPDWEKYVVSDPSHKRPAELHALKGDPSRAAQVLGWKPKVDFQGLVKMMVEADLERVKKEIK